MKKNVFPIVFIKENDTYIEFYEFFIEFLLLKSSKAPSFQCLPCVPLINLTDAKKKTALVYRRSQNVNSSFSRRGVKAHTGTLRPEMSQAVVRRLRTTACQLSRANSTLCAFAPPRVRKNGRTSYINLAHYRRSNVL